MSFLTWFASKLLANDINDYQTEISDLKDQLSAANTKISQLNTAINNMSQNTIKTPVETGKISIGDVSQILAPYCGSVYLSDTEYSLTTIDSAAVYTMESKVSAQKWVENAHDCDNFSFALAGYWSDSLKSFSIGIAWSQSHAFNIGIFTDKDGKNPQVYIIEPQTNAFMPIETLKENTMYFPLRLVII